MHANGAAQNYLNSIASVMTYIYRHEFAVTPEVLAMEPTPLTQCINLRGQAEKESKTEQMFDARVGGWCSWAEVQNARLAAEQALADAGAGQKRAKLKECAAISLLSLIPPE